MSVDRSEVVVARGVGVGIGLIALMLVWLVGSRLAELVWDPPVGPVVAFAAAIVVGLVASIVFGRRLAERVRRDWASEARSAEGEGQRRLLARRSR